MMPCYLIGRTVINGMKEFGYDVYGHGVDGRILTELDQAISEIRAHARSKANFLKILEQWHLVSKLSF